MKLNFKECTLAQLDKLFHLEQINEQAAIQTWLQNEAEISNVERQVLTLYQQSLKDHAHDWNEVELAQHFIGPVFALVSFSDKKFNLFAERAFEGKVEGIEMSGRPDSIIASGFREPEKPYFCFQEYKKHKDPEGDPAAQALAAMLVAQEINEHKHPIYGANIFGRAWYFMTLEGKTYSISEPYIASRDDLFDIFRILKVLKKIIAKLVKQHP